VCAGGYIFSGIVLTDVPETVESACVPLLFSCGTRARPQVAATVAIVRWRPPPTSGSCRGAAAKLVLATFRGAAATVACDA